MDDDDFMDQDTPDGADPTSAAPDPLADSGWTAGDFLNGQGLLGMRPLGVGYGADGSWTPPPPGLDPSQGAPPGIGPVQVSAPPTVTPMPSQAPADLTQQEPDTGPLTLPHYSHRQGRVNLRPMHLDPGAAHAGPHGKIGSGHVANILPLVGTTPSLAAGLSGGHGFPWPTPPWLTKGRPL